MVENYFIATSLSLSDEGALDWCPYPTEFYPQSEIKVDGDGDLVGMGLFNFKWTSGDGMLTATQWNWLMAFFSGWEPSIEVYVRTRTDRVTQDSLGDDVFDYRWFQAVMHRPKGEPYHGYRYRNVEIVFTHAEEV